MDEFVLDKMKHYVAITQKNSEAQEHTIQELTDELVFTATLLVLDRVLLL